MSYILFLKSTPQLTNLYAASSMICDFTKILKIVDLEL